MTATLDNPDYTATAATGTLVIGQATPTLTWAVPASITAGTPLGAAQLDAIASFDGMPLAGVLTYTPAAGTVLPAGSGQTLTVSFTPTDGTDFKAVTSSVPINVLPQSTSPPQPTPTPTSRDGHRRAARLPAQAQQAWQTRRQGGPDRIHARLQHAARRGGRVESGELRAGHRHDQEGQEESSIASCIRSTGFTVTYTPASDSVTLELAGAQSFRTGGQITVLPGVTGDSGSALIGTTVFTIAPGGKKIGPS